MSNYQLKIVPVSKRAARFHPPAFTIMVKEVDENGNYVKFAKQDPELIEMFNEAISGMTVTKKEAVLSEKKPKVFKGPFPSEGVDRHLKKFGHLPSECGGGADMCPKKTGY